MAKRRPVRFYRSHAHVDEAKAQGLADTKTDRVLDGLQAELGRWTWLDRWSLRLGAALLFIAFALKMIHNACNC